MYSCPRCGGQFKRRKEGLCPGCGLEITVIEGIWFSSETDVIDAFIQHWNHLICNKLGVTVHISKRNVMYRAERKAAAKLLGEAETLEIALEAISFLFSSPKFSWKTYSSLYQVFPDWSVATAVAKAQAEKAKKLAAASEDALSKIPELDIFERLYGKHNNEIE